MVPAVGGDISADLAPRRSVSATAKQRALAAGIVSASHGSG
jgi:hypothetical protein